MALDDAATITVGVSGDLDTLTPDMGSVVKLTFAADTLTTQALHIGRVSGTVRVIGWRCYVAGGGISVLNMGRSGWRTDQLADASAYYSPRNAIASIGASLVIVESGLNDRAAGRLPSLFQAEIDALVTSIKGSGADVVLVVSFAPGGASTYLWSEYQDAIRAVGVARNVPVVDMVVRLGDRAQVEAIGWQTDDNHPNAAGLAEKAYTLKNLLEI